MAKVALCHTCKAQTPPHCDAKGCGWVTCPTHGILRLTPDQRKALGDA